MNESTELQLATLITEYFDCLERDEFDNLREEGECLFRRLDIIMEISENRRYLEILGCILRENDETSVDEMIEIMSSFHFSHIKK